MLDAIAIDVSPGVRRVACLICRRDNGNAVREIDLPLRLEADGYKTRTAWGERYLGRFQVYPFESEAFVVLGAKPGTSTKRYDGVPLARAAVRSNFRGVVGDFGIALRAVGF